jgi:phosphate transport system substrate-binding protein
MFRKNANLAQALSVTAALAAVLAAVPSAHAQGVPAGAIPAVTADPLAVRVPNTAGTILVPTDVVFPNFPILSELSTDPAVQFHGLGATFPQLLYRNVFDYVGIAVPQNPSQTDTLTPGLNATNPAGSPRVRHIQVNYNGTGSGNGRGVFIGTAAIPPTATYIPSLTPGFVCAPDVPGSATTPPVQVPLPCQGAPVPYASGSVSFAGTDVPLSATEITSYTTNQFPTRGNPIQVPTLFGGIAVAYNRTGGPAGTIDLSTADLCRIFNGTFTNYNQLTAPSTTGVSGPITVEIRLDSSGTTNGFTSFLANACPVALGTPYFLAAGVNTFPAAGAALTGPNYSNFVRSNGNTGVTNAIGSTSGGLGYIEASFTSLYQAASPAIPNPPTAARLQVGGNGATFVSPLTANVRAAIATGLTLVPNATYPTTVFTVGGLVSSIPSVIPTAANSYPITVPTYLLAYTRYSTSGTAGNGPANPGAADALKAVFGNAFLLGNRTTPIGPNDQLAQQIGFSLPSNPFRATSRNAVNTITQAP